MPFHPIPHGAAMLIPARPCLASESSLAPLCSQNSLGPLAPQDSPSTVCPCLPHSCRTILLLSSHTRPALKGLQGPAPRNAFTQCCRPGHRSSAHPLFPAPLLFPFLWLQIKHRLLPFSQFALCHGYLFAYLTFFTSLRIHGEQRQEISLSFVFPLTPNSMPGL